LRGEVVGRVLSDPEEGLAYAKAGAWLQARKDRTGRDFPFEIRVVFHPFTQMYEVAVIDTTGCEA